MKKPKTYIMKEANKVGISRLVRDAEEVGLVILRRNGVDVGLLMPLTFRGVSNLQAMIQELLADPSKLKDNPDLAAALPAVLGAMERKVSENLSEGPGNAGEQPGSAGQGGVTRRRRNESK